MIQKTLKVALNLRINENVAKEVADAVLMRANPHQSELTDKRLTEAEITRENLMKYFTEVGKAVAQFWENQDDSSAELTLKPHELRGLYMPVIYGVIFSSIGNIQIGNYLYVVKAKDNGLPDKKFLIEFSAKLESVRDVLKGATGQIGNRAAQPQTTVMSCLLGEVAESGRTASMLIRDGVKVDNALAGLSTMVGLSLVEEAYTCMYTGYEEVNFRQLTDSLVDKGLMAVKKDSQMSESDN